MYSFQQLNQGQLQGLTAVAKAVRRQRQGSAHVQTVQTQQYTGFSLSMPLWLSCFVTAENAKRLLACVGDFGNNQTCIQDAVVSNNLMIIIQAPCA